MLPILDNASDWHLRSHDERHNSIRSTWRAVSDYGLPHLAAFTTAQLDAAVALERLEDLGGEAAIGDDGWWNDSDSDEPTFQEIRGYDVLE